MGIGSIVLNSASTKNFPNSGMWIVYFQGKAKSVPIVNIVGGKIFVEWDTSDIGKGEISIRKLFSTAKLPVVLTGPFPYLHAATNWLANYENPADIIASKMNEANKRPMPKAKPGLGAMFSENNFFNRIFWSKKSVDSVSFPHSGIYIKYTIGVWKIFRFDRYEVTLLAVSENLSQSTGFVQDIKQFKDALSRFPLVITGPFRDLSSAKYWAEHNPNQADVEFAKAGIATAFAKKQKASLGFSLFGDNEHVVEEKVAEIVTGTPKVTDSGATNPLSTTSNVLQDFAVQVPSVRLDSSGTAVSVILPDQSIPTTQVTTDSMKVDVVAAKSGNQPEVVANVSVSPEGKLVTAATDTANQIQQAINNAASEPDSILKNRKFQIAVAALLFIWWIRR